MGTGGDGTGRPPRAPHPHLLLSAGRGTPSSRWPSRCAPTRRARTPGSRWPRRRASSRPRHRGTNIPPDPAAGWAAAAPRAPGAGRATDGGGGAGRNGARGVGSPRPPVLTRPKMAAGAGAGRGGREVPLGGGAAGDSAAMLRNGAAGGGAAAQRPVRVWCDGW